MIDLFLMSYFSVFGALFGLFVKAACILIFEIHSEIGERTEAMKGWATIQTRACGGKLWWVVGGSVLETSSLEGMEMPQTTITSRVVFLSFFFFIIYNNYIIYYFFPYYFLIIRHAIWKGEVEDLGLEGWVWLKNSVLCYDSRELGNGAMIKADNKKCLWPNPLMPYLLGLFFTQLSARTDIPALTVLPTNVHTLWVLWQRKVQGHSVTLAERLPCHYALVFSRVYFSHRLSW